MSAKQLTRWWKKAVNDTAGARTLGKFRLEGLYCICGVDILAYHTFLAHARHATVNPDWIRVAPVLANDPLQAFNPKPGHCYKNLF